MTHEERRLTIKAWREIGYAVHEAPALASQVISSCNTVSLPRSTNSFLA